MRNTLIAVLLGCLSSGFLEAFETGALDLPRRIAELMQTGKVTEAQQLLTVEIRAQPNDAIIRNLMGVVEGELGNYEAAQAQFQKALALAPNSVSILENLARLHIRNLARQPKAATNARLAYGAVLRQQPNNIAALYELAYLDALAGNCSESLAGLTKLPDDIQKRPSVRALDFACHAGQKPMNLSEADVLRILPILARSGRAKDAEDLLPQPSPAVLIQLARIAYDSKDPRRAMEYLALTRHLRPSDASVHYFLGITAVALDMHAEAKRSFQRALELDGTNPYQHYALGSVLVMERDATPAIPHFEKYCEMRPDDVRGRFALAVARYYALQTDAAVAEFEKLVDHNETAAGAHFFLGRIARSANDLEKAAAHLKQSLELFGAQPDARAELAQVYVNQKSFEAAQEQLRLALDADPNNYKANLALQVFYQRTKDPRVADQRRKVETLTAARDDKEKVLWRTIEFRPY